MRPPFTCLLFIGGATSVSDLGMLTKFYQWRAFVNGDIDCEFTCWTNFDVGTCCYAEFLHDVDLRWQSVVRKGILYGLGSLA